MLYFVESDPQAVFFNTAFTYKLIAVKIRCQQPAVSIESRHGLKGRMRKIIGKEGIVLYIDVTFLSVLILPG